MKAVRNLPVTQKHRHNHRKTKGSSRKPTTVPLHTRVSRKLQHKSNPKSWIEDFAHIGRVRGRPLNRPFTPARLFAYRTIDNTSCEIVSNVVTVFEFASNARCATIRLENSVEILTLDCSSAPSSIVPRPPAPATPTVARPDAAVVVKLFPPKPSTLRCSRPSPRQAGRSSKSAHC